MAIADGGKGEGISFFFFFSSQLPFNSKNYDLFPANKADLSERITT
jgi:hypothetical protein